MQGKGKLGYYKTTNAFPGCCELSSRHKQRNVIMKIKSADLHLKPGGALLKPNPSQASRERVDKKTRQVCLAPVSILA